MIESQVWHEAVGKKKSIRVIISIREYPILIARKSALEKTQLSDVLITDNSF